MDKLICSADVSHVKGRKVVIYYTMKCLGQIHVDVALFIQQTFSWSVLYFFLYSILNSYAGSVNAYDLGFYVFW